MSGLLVTVFVASVLGSLHCIGMCGPFALLAGTSGSKDRERQPAWFLAASYSLGRLVTYSLVGALSGLIGLAINSGTSSVGWQQTATYLAGILMIVIGVIAVSRYLGLVLRLPNFLTPLISRRLQSLMRMARRQPPARRALMIGMTTSLMPCGWLYTFAIAAAGTGDPVLGAMLMASFWLGTVPAMSAVILGATRLSQSVLSKAPMAMALLVIVIGIFTLAYRAPIAFAGQVGPAGSLDEVKQQVQSVDHSELPCCSGKQSP